jgi:hypothetical protein
MLAHNHRPSPATLHGELLHEVFSPATSRLLIGLMIGSMLLPVFPEIGGMRLDPYRVFFLLSFIPFSFYVLSGRTGGVLASDLLMLFASFWMILTYVYHHGTEMLPYSVVLTSEMLGGYYAGRVLIRNARDYRIFIGYLFMSLLIMLPFAVYELFTFRAPIPEFLGKFLPSQEKYLDARTAFNLSRVQVVFPHPILFGLYCSFILGNVYYIFTNGKFRKIGRILIVGIMSWMSLSSAAILSLAFQGTMIGWDIIMRGKWKLLFGIVSFIYVFLSIFSNRGPVILIIEYLTLNPQTAWWRVHIWNFGSASVWNHPFFGIGLNDWVRPIWLAPTIDNFWLVLAMRYGLPFILFFLAAIAIHISRILRKKDLNADLSLVRTGYMVSLVGLILSLATVHIWNALGALVPFYIGAGAFLYTSNASATVRDEVESSRPVARGMRATLPATQYTRFPKTVRRQRATEHLPADLVGYAPNAEREPDL